MFGRRRQNFFYITLQRMLVVTWFTVKMKLNQTTRCPLGVFFVTNAVKGD